MYLVVSDPGVTVTREPVAQFAQRAYVKASNSDAYDNLGFDVAVDGDTLVVGAHYERSGATGINGNQDDDSVDEAGAVYVFH